MKKLSLISFALLATSQFINAQNISSKKWEDLFSYNNVFAIKEGDGKFVAATENGVFYYTISSGEITKLSKANGLHDVKLSAFDFNPQSKIGVIGYENGALDVITPDGVTYVVDIPLAIGYNGSKKINHISISGDRAVISVGYGVSIFNIKRKEFEDSAFFRTGSTYEASNEATIRGNKVFSVTNSGLKTHELDITFPVFSTWQTEMTGSFTQIDSEDQLVFSSPTTAYVYNNGSPLPLTQNFSNIKDIVVNSDNFVITDGIRIYTYNPDGSYAGNVSVGEQCNTATKVGSKVYFGTVLSGLMSEDNIAYRPDGPYYNIAYKLRVLGNNQLLVSTGARKDDFNQAQLHPKNPGFYYFSGTEWVYPSLFINSTTNYNVLDAISDPVSPDEVFFTNYNNSAGYGVYKMKYDAANKDFEFIKNYTLSAPNEWVKRPVGFAYDNQNNLFVSVAFTGSSATNPGMAYYDRATDDFLVNDVTITSSGAQHPVYYQDLFWVPLPRSNDFMVYDTKKTPSLSDDTQYILTAQNGLPPSSGSNISVAIDKSGDAWIGTDVGLRILRNAAGNIKNNPTVEPIIIEQNGLAEELFRDSKILQIEVDGGNQKWISVEDGGVYYLSEDGERVLKRFTKENSPLPTNTVTDIKVDRQTGKIYFATFDGIVTYQGDVAEVNSGFGKVLVYPNPVVYSQFKGNVMIKGLAEKTNIRITDAAGNVVHSDISRNGYYEWNLNNQKGQRVASGIYFVLMTNEDASDTATAKIAVVN